MDRNDRKSRIREYKENPPDAGVYRIRNAVTGRVLLGSAVNAAGRLNRHRFQLKGGSHPDAELQADWNELGEDGFEFAVVDSLEPREDPDYDPADDLALLQSMWRDRLAGSGQAFYGEG